MPLMLSNRSDPIECRLVVYAKARQGRRSPNRRTPNRTSRSTASMKASAREREPWLIVASPQLHGLTARQLVNLYARRMQIELGFRDLKSHRYGQGMEETASPGTAHVCRCSCSSARWRASSAGSQAWGARPPALHSGSRPTAASASSTQPRVSDAKRWSGDGRLNPSPDGWTACDHCRQTSSIR